MGFFSDLFGGGSSVGEGPDTSQYEAQAQQLLQQALGSIKSGYGQALQTTAGIGAANAQQIQDTGTQSAGNLLSRLTSSGLLNSSVAPNLARGITADQSRSLLQNNANIGGLLGNLQVGQGQAVGGAQSALAQNLVGRGQRDRSFFLDRSGLQLKADELNNQTSSQLGGGIGSFLTTGFKGEFGGALGSLFGS
jgi:hypothetical protein